MISGVLFGLLLVWSQSTAIGLASTSTADSETAFGVAVAQNQTLEEALVMLATAKPELTPRIVGALLKTNSRQGNAFARQLQTGESPASTVHPFDADATNDLLRIGQRSSTPHFEGSLTITGYDCTSAGCVAVSQLTHNGQFDLGYTTFMVTGKTSGVRTNWTKVGAVGFCHIGVRAPCSPTNTFPSGTTWNQTIIGFSTNMGGKTARVLVTFNASWRGAPAGLSGWTPYFSCETSTRQCKFAT